MKKLILITLVSLTTLSSAFAQRLEAKSLRAMLKEVMETEFTFKERGMVFGFDTIQSCFFVAEDIAVFKNYCFPKKEYPAKGYTIISKKYGMIDIYQEALPQIQKRDFQITQFPEILAPYLTTNPEDQTLEGMSAIIAKMHYQYLPACWSSNFSWYTEGVNTACNVPLESVENFEAWQMEAEAIETDSTRWNSMIKDLEAKFKI